nr:IS4 family transposase [Leptolyngbya sp. FACHB-60]
MFEQVFKDLVPLIHQRWAERVQRPLPESVTVALRSFERVWIADGSTLEALFRKLKSLEDAKVAELGGKMMVILDLVRQTPVAVWIEANPYTHDTAFMPRLHQAIGPKTLMILDRGFWDFRFFESLIRQGAGFITRVRANGPIEVLKPLSESPWHRDSQVRLGKGYQGNPILTLRLVEVRRGQQWHTYLTSVLDPTVLPPGVVADLYQRRWRIEESFNLVKRLLGLSYLWTGSPNGIRLQVWATWIIYLVLVDLADDLANALSLPVERLSLEMIFRGLYHFSVAHSKGPAHDLIAYFTDPANADLGTVKAWRKKPPRLTFDPAPTTLTSQTYA